jgi:hypothetical protein
MKWRELKNPPASAVVGGLVSRGRSTAEDVWCRIWLKEVKMMRNWRSKRLIWWVTVAVLISGAGYLSIGSDLLEAVYAAPASSNHVTVDLMSPIFAVKLEHSEGI